MRGGGEKYRAKIEQTKKQSAVAQFLALLPHSEKVVDSIDSLVPFCVDVACFPLLHFHFRMTMLLEL